MNKSADQSYKRSKSGPIDYTGMNIE